MKNVLPLALALLPLTLSVACEKKAEPAPAVNEDAEVKDTEAVPTEGTPEAAPAEGTEAKPAETK